MSVDGSAGTALLGLDGFRLLAVSEAYGELEQLWSPSVQGAGQPQEFGHVGAGPRGQQARW